MTRLSQILGFVFLGAGAVLAVLSFLMPGSMQVYGLTPEVAAILLAGGAICIGLTGVVDAMHADHGAVDAPAPIDDLRRMPVTPERPRMSEPFAKPDFKSAERVVTSGAAAAIVTETIREAPAEARPSVAETIQALEQAKSEIASALGMDKPAAPETKAKPTITGILEKPVAEKPAPEKLTRSEPPAVLVMPPPPPPPPPPPIAEAAEEAEEADDPDLYVVEEKVIRGRPARVLSDGTVEAETDEGWMRFENLEHLDEYLDAMSPGA